MKCKTIFVFLFGFFFLLSSYTFALEWARTYGGSDGDDAVAIQQTKDGGYVVAGKTDSFGVGSGDIWVLKLDRDGNIEWQKTYGGSGRDMAFAIQQTEDGGYVVAGYTDSFNASSEDIWVLKLYANGSIEWQKTYGGSGWDRAFAIQQTKDGGYVVAGDTTSFGAGRADIWVLKLDRDGNIEWQKTYGGSGWDWASAIQQTEDGGYVVAGDTDSFNASSEDIWVLKLDANGTIEWQKTYGGSGWDRASAIQQTEDGGYVVAGWTASFGAGNGDIWVLKLDANGNITNCPYEGISSASVSDTNASVNSTDVSVNETSADLQDTVVSPQDSNATVFQVCFYSGPSERMAVPALTHWGLALLAFMLSIAALYSLRKSRFLFR